MLLTSYSVDLNKCCSNPNEPRITVVGTAIVLKHHAFVLTDDSLHYYLDAIDDWADEFRGKRVKVTGRLVIKEYRFQKSPNPEITAIPQQRLGTWKIIKKPKWSLVR